MWKSIQKREDENTIEDETHQPSEEQWLNAIVSSSTSAQQRIQQQQQQRHKPEAKLNERPCHTFIVTDSCYANTQGTCKYNHDPRMIQMHRKKLLNEWKVGDNRLSTFHNMSLLNAIFGDREEVVKQYDELEQQAAGFLSKSAAINCLR